MPKRSPTSDFFYFLMFASTLRTKYLSQSEKALVCIEKLEAMVINRDVLAGFWGCYRGGLGGLLVGSKICYKFSCVPLSFRHPRRLRGGSSRARAAVPPMCSPCLSRARSRSTKRWVPTGGHGSQGPRVKRFRVGSHGVVSEKLSVFEVSGAQNMKVTAFKKCISVSKCLIEFNQKYFNN